MTTSTTPRGDTGRRAPGTAGGASASARSGGTEHLLTVDVEEYFHVSAFEDVVDREEWDSYPSLVDEHVDELLELFAAHGAEATFFVLGWVAERHPGVVRRIHDAGHDVASHGWSHRKVHELDIGEFRREVSRSREVLEEITGQEVVGFRAPSFSIAPGMEDALDVLLEEGYRYDSSLYPIRRPGYGYPGVPPKPHRIVRSAGAVLELPPATTSWGGFRIPAGGGAYFRHLPYGLCRRAFAERTEEGEAGVFYVHPWELDPDQPRVDAPWLSRLRHYRGLERTRDRLERLLSEFRFTSIRSWCGSSRDRREDVEEIDLAPGRRRADRERDAPRWIPERPAAGDIAAEPPSAEDREETIPKSRSSS